MPNKINSVLCLIVKNEEQDILEWIAHHSLIGFERIVIYDNESDDRTAEIVDAASVHFPVERILWRNDREPVPGLTKQGAAYTHCITTWKNQANWLCFLDGDEFLIPPKNETLPSLLARHDNEDAFVINWMTFGSSNLDHSRNRLVMEAFTGRGAGARSVNQHVKMFLRPDKAGRVLNPHFVATAKVAVAVDGSKIDWMLEGVVAPGTVIQGDWRIHHYIIRSKEHWKRRVARKQPGGQVREWDSFRSNDDSSIPDRSAYPSAARVREKLAELGHIYEPVPFAADDKSNRSPVECIVDEISAKALRGWAYNPNNDEPVEISFAIDDVRLGKTTCSDLRPDVGASEIKREQVGFQLKIPSRFLDNAEHWLTVYDEHGRQVHFIHNQRRLNSTVFKDLEQLPVIGNLDTPTNTSLRGWVAVAPADGAGRFATRRHIKVTYKNLTIATGIADIARPDVAAAHGIDRHCGFAIEIPLEYRQGPPHTFRVFTMPENIEIRGSPLTVNLDAGEHGTAIMRIDKLLDECTSLMQTRSTNKTRKLTARIRAAQKITRSLIPTNNLSISNYEPWLALHDRAIRADMQQHRMETGPLVSIVCPVYRPDLADFRKAIASLTGQTYHNIEIILCDDGGGYPAISAAIAAEAAADPRIKFAIETENRGISESTNICLRMAKGQWIAFFDHDDLLAPYAIERMMLAATRTGAAIVYSDEDKIDERGRFSEPMFKPAWNYRYLLGVNYINHLTMIDAGTLRSAGLLDNALNGAQDHDLLLRCVELCRPDQIVHVPEVLYHWRKTASSTATAIEAKPYAIAAGIKAVSRHLERRGIPNRVYSVDRRTFYRITTTPATRPKIAIVIPFRDQMHFTARCVTQILNHTTHHDFTVVLVNNGSTSQEAADFMRDARSNPSIVVLDYDQPFNYSAINNFAVASLPTDHTLLVLMNNDLFVQNDDWLDIMINEMTIDSTVGIVGGKYLFENRTIQHCGVVLGFGGVAGHAFTHESEHHPGYAARAILSHQVSAVTAACLLIRRNVFETVGGFDEAKLTVAFNDIDLCMKVAMAGWKIVLAPDFVAEHHESVSRGLEDNPEKVARFKRETTTMKRRWKSALKNDPFFPRAFSRHGKTFQDLQAPQMPSRAQKRATNAAPTQPNQAHPSQGYLSP